MKLVTDACSLINIHNADGLTVVSGLEEFSIVVPPLVLEECNEDCARKIRDLAVANAIEILDDNEVTAELFSELSAAHGLGDGETECLSFCMLTDWHFCCDDRKARRCGNLLLGDQRVIGSLRLLRECVNTKLILCDQANSMYVRMVRHGGFLPTVAQEFFCNTAEIVEC
jgi:predicted nucleic acid-binding protein